ncbi:SGNH/GDSL hydrolase family protein [Niabella terrae]
MPAYFLITCQSAKSAAYQKKDSLWTGSWATALQLVEPGNMPPSPGLDHHSLRQIIRVSIGGNTLRLRFSNLFGREPLVIKKVSMALAADSSRIMPPSLQWLQFSHQDFITLPAGAEAWSDPIRFPLASGARLAITIYSEQVPVQLTGHPGSRTTSYILKDDRTGSADFQQAVKTDHWYLISRLDVLSAPEAAAVAVLGNSITDGRGSGTNQQNRWTDILSERLLKNPTTRNIAVLNLGIGGNCVLRGGLGPTALERFERDILTQSNVRWLILLEGINDIGSTRDAVTAGRVSRELMNAYERMARLAQAKGIKVYAATLLPFGGSFYDSSFRQPARDSLNVWIRRTDTFDGLVDFDTAMRDPTAIKMLQKPLQDGDMLHPNEAGYRKMGETVDLSLFTWRPKK